MTEATNTGVMDTEAGGEQTQYEGVHTFVKPHAKQTGHMGASDSTTSENADQTEADAHAARGQKTAENIRYGEAISEHGFGGETTGTDSSTAQEGYGKMKTTDEDLPPTRREQGYGGGNDIGA